MRPLFFLVVVYLGSLLSLSAKEPSPKLAAVLGKGPSTSVQDRLLSVKALGERLDQTDQDSLLTYLNSTKERPEGFTAKQWEAYFNDLLSILVRQINSAIDLSPFLQSLSQDEERSLVLRDYALQHLGDWLLKQDNPTEQAINHLREAAAAIEESYAATALLSLKRLHQVHTEQVSTRELGALAMAILESEKAPSGAKATAMAVAIETPLQSKVSTLAKQWVLDEAQPLNLRLGALGALKQAEDTVTLESLLQSENPWLRDAAKQALSLKDQ